MDPRSQTLYDNHNESILGKVSALFSIDIEKLKLLGGFESLVFEFEKDTRCYILKLTHSLHRTPDQVTGELEWVDYLSKNGVSVCAVIPSANGNLLEVIEVEDSYFIVYVFEKAPGDTRRISDWDDNGIRGWGRIVGKMHALTKDYRPGSEATTRSHWYDESFRHLDCVPEDQTKAKAAMIALETKLKQLPIDSDSYGLVHSDLHHGNLIVDDGSLVAIDFDDCNYNWFAYDLAMPFFYAIRDTSLGDDPASAQRYWDLLKEGYAQEYSLDPVWFEYVPDFLKLREAELYVVLYMADAIDDGDWVRAFMKDRTERIANGTPVIEGVKFV